MDHRPSIFCRICERQGLNKKAKSRDLVVHHPDASTWAHYERETGHAFHQALSGHPPQILDCDCAAPD